MKLQSLGIQFTEDCVQVLDPSTGETIAELDFDAAEAVAKFIIEECENVKRRRLQ